MEGEERPDRILDITGERCPMTFVRTRLALDRLEDGAVLEVRLRGAEAERNVPAQSVALGHAVLSQAVGSDGVTRLLVRKGAARVKIGRPIGPA